MTPEESIKIFKCLQDRSRLEITAMLMAGDAKAEAIAERMGLAASTVSFHMKKLEEANLVSSKKDGYYTVYSLNRRLLGAKLSDLVTAGTGEKDMEAIREEEFRVKVIKAFFEYGRLRQIPAQRKKKLICYEEIMKAVEPGRRYEEKEISEILAGFHEDYCTMRRDMISEGILRREGSVYERIR